MLIRWTLLIAAALLLGGTHLTVAQTRTTRPRDPAAVVTGHIRQTAPPADPSPAPRSVSQLRFEPRPDIRQLPGPLHTRSQIRSPGFILLSPWGWNGVWNGVMPFPVAAAPTGLVPQSESDLLGGVQLDVQPWRAQVYVDGAYAGLVENFTGYYRPLELVSGPHVIMIVAPDYDPLILEMVVSPGQTITYRNTLTRTSGR